MHHWNIFAGGRLRKWWPEKNVELSEIRITVSHIYFSVQYLLNTATIQLLQ